MDGKGWRLIIYTRYETSAKEDINITKAIRTLVQHILDNDPEVVNGNKEAGTNFSFSLLFIGTNVCFADGFKLTDDQVRDDNTTKKEPCC
jgi:hypothetical protein